MGPLIMQHARKFIKDEDLVDLKLSVWGALSCQHKGARYRYRLLIVGMTLFRR